EFADRVVGEEIGGIGPEPRLQILAVAVLQPLHRTDGFLRAEPASSRSIRAVAVPGTDGVLAPNAACAVSVSAQIERPRARIALLMKPPLHSAHASRCEPQSLGTACDAVLIAGANRRALHSGRSSCSCPFSFFSLSQLTVPSATTCT